jgi:flagellar protein FlgJ
MPDTKSSVTSQLDTTHRASYDMQSLAAMRMAAHQNPQQTANQVAHQFETVFANMLLKSMRDATPSGDLLTSDQTKMFTGMLDEQLAQQTSGRGIGLADMMLKQLTRNGQAAPTAGNGLTSAALTPTGRAYGAQDAIGVADGAPAAAGEFVERMADAAQNAATATGIPARFMLGQAALESGWGKREIRRGDGSTSFNVFGIKAGKNWTGPTVEAMTTEYVNGVPQRVKARFRAYGSYQEAFTDYGNLIRNNPRYASVMGSAGDAQAFAQGLQKAGYATDPAYASKLMRVIRHFA